MKLLLLVFLLQLLLLLLMPLLLRPTALQTLSQPTPPASHRETQTCPTSRCTTQARLLARD